MFCCFCCCRHDVMMAHTWIQALLSARQKKLLRPNIVKTKSFFDFKRSKLDLKFIRCAILKKLFLSSSIRLMMLPNIVSRIDVIDLSQSKRRLAEHDAMSVLKGTHVKGGKCRRWRDSWQANEHSRHSRIMIWLVINQGWDLYSRCDAILRAIAKFIIYR